VIEGWVSCKLPGKVDSRRGVARQKTRGAHKESRIHKLLKSYVLVHSEQIFGPSWRPYAAEYVFPETGDRADVILQGPRGQRLVVEVERNAHDLAGVLQALKYQAMLPVKEPVPRARVRAALAALHFAPEVARACQDHGVEAVKLSL
jgi:RecB family endonuclease NucS